IADSLVAGKFISEAALAAVGNSYEITLIFIAFAFGCNIGCSVLVSQYFGAKDYSRMKSTISTTFITSGILIALLILFGTGFCGTLLQLINTPAELMADSKLYLDIYIWGLPFLFFYNIATGIFSALGDSKTPFVFLAFSSTANILVDILFVKGFGMGVAGVAWATFLCQGISCILSLIVVYRRLAAIESRVKAKLFSKSIFFKFLGIAIPSTLQQSFISVGNIIIQRVINGFGSSVMAGYAASVKLNNMVISSYTTIGNGISNYSAQNNGAGKYDRIHDGFKSGIKMVWLISLPIVLLYFIAGKYLLLLFLEDRGGVAMMTGMTFLRILSPFYFVVSAKLVADGILRGTGRMTQFMIATFTDLILRVVLAIGLSRTVLGATGIWCAWPIGWTIAAVMSVFFYKRIQFGHKESAKS
ncbi:MAG: MATE family efflux transporter, partial [Lachnospiraceae bacterium]|nr:MATE family efflux transporter [Lachnospiraceae bacterium]